MQTFKQMLAGQEVVPVVAVGDKAEALGLAEALLKGGVSVIEVTLRNEFALHALKLIRAEFPEMTLLAGTVNTAEQFAKVVDVGVDGIISPGLSPALARIASTANTPYLPGVATASDIVLALEYNLLELKLFPAAVVGGVSALKAFSGPFPTVSFCPTGGISEADYKNYLKLDNVMCVGGSWIAPTSAVAAHDWATIMQSCERITKTQ